MAYSTIDIIRDDTGLYGDPSVDDTIIETYINQAYNIVLSFCAAVYKTAYLKSDVLDEDSQAFGYLQRCEVLLASGYLLIKLYGGEINGDKDGYDKVAEGKQLLKMLSDNPPVRLIDEDGDELPKNELARIEGKVDSGSIGSSTPIFSVNDSY